MITPACLIENYYDSLVITANIGTNIIIKILIDNSSSIDILYHITFSRMDFGDRKLENVNLPLYGFTRNEVKVVGTIDLPVLFGTLRCQVWKVIKFHVFNATSSYNTILGRTILSSL